VTERAEPSAEWQALHKRSARAVLRAQAATQRKIDQTTRREVAAAAAALLMLGDEPSRSAVIRSVRQARESLAAALADDIDTGRSISRRLSAEQLQLELAQAEQDAKKHGTAKDAAVASTMIMALAMRRRSKPIAVTAEDAMYARLAASSLANSWTQRAMAAVGDAGRAETSAAAAVARTPAGMKPGIKRTAQTEAARAFQSEHVEALAGAAESAAGKERVPFLMRVWIAINDKRTCGTCRAHDGETVPTGTPFSGGDEPGWVHPKCGCSESLETIFG